MSSLYRVRVDDVNPPKVRLTVWQIHPDAGVPPKSLTFALFALCASFQKTRLRQGSAPSLRSPLARAIDVDGGQYLHEAWMIENARAFIERFSRSGLKNARRSLDWASLDDEDLDPLPQAVFELVATDPAWVSHLKPGLSWNTAAYDMGQAKPAPARRPGQPTAAATKPASTSKRAAVPQRKTNQSQRKATPRNAGSVRRLEFIRGTSKKFWEIELGGNSLTTRYGRIGASVRETEKQFVSATEAKATFDKLIIEKLAKGYREAARPSSRGRA